jgi:Domain of unknown function (DUF4403)
MQSPTTTSARLRVSKSVALVKCGVLSACAVTFIGCDNFTVPAPPQKPPSQNSAPILEDSSASVTVPIPLAAAFAKLDAAIPQQDIKWDAWIFTEPDGVWAYEYALWRDPLKFSLVGNELSVELDGRYKARGGRRVGGHVVTLGSCGDGEPLREIQAKLSTPIQLLPNWTFKSQCNVSLNYPNRCTVSLLNIDVTDKINDLIQPHFQDAAKEIDSKVAGYDFRSVVQDFWNELDSPIQLADQAWLLINPKSVQVSPINGTGAQVDVSVGLVGRPVVAYGSKPPSPSDPLPNFQSATPGNSFHIAVEGTIPFDAASKALTKSIVGRRYTYAGHYETIDGASVYGTGDQVVLQLKLGGSLKGTIYLIGTPTFDAAKNQFSVPDLDYTVETQNAFVKLADWMNHPGFRDSLRAACVWDAGNQVSGAQALIKQGLNRQVGPHVTLSCDKLTLRPIGVYLTATEFRLRAALDGSVSVSLK